jgi:hypothetical protein
VASGARARAGGGIAVGDPGLPVRFYSRSGVRARDVGRRHAAVPASSPYGHERIPPGRGVGPRMPTVTSCRLTTCLTRERSGIKKRIGNRAKRAVWSRRGQVEILEEGKDPEQQAWEHCSTSRSEVGKGIPRNYKVVTPELTLLLPATPPPPGRTPSAASSSRPPRYHRRHPQTHRAAGERRRRRMYVLRACLSLPAEPTLS